MNANIVFSSNNDLSVNVDTPSDIFITIKCGEDTIRYYLKLGDEGIALEEVLDDELVPLAQALYAESIAIQDKYNPETE